MKGSMLENMANTGRDMLKAASTVILIGTAAYMLADCTPQSTSQQTSAQTSNSRFVPISAGQIRRQREVANALAERPYSQRAADQYFCARIARLTDKFNLTNKSNEEQYLLCLRNYGFFQ